MSPLVSLHRISFSYADKPVISDATFAVNDGQTVGLMGVNGVGKSTLLRLIAGDLTPETGTVTRRHMDHDLAFFHQRLTPQPGVSVQDYLATRTGIASAEASFLDASDAFAAGAISAETYDSVLQRYLDADVASFGDRALAALGDLGGFDRLWTQDVSTLSGGELSAVQLASIVLSKARLIVLDEPTNNVDAAGLAVLDEFLHNHSGAVVLVSHDRALLRRHVTDVVVIDEFTRTCTPFHGGWEVYEREAERAANRAQAAYDAYDVRRTELENRAKKERQWSEQGQRRATSAKRRREEPDKHLRHWAVVSAQNVSGRAKATERELARLEAVEEPREPWRLQLLLTAGGPTSTDALVVEQAEVSLGGKRWGPMNFELSVGERVRLAGPNGSGKTTLLRTALGELELVAGSVRRSPSVRLGYMDQRRSVFQADSPVVDVVRQKTGLGYAEARTLLAKFRLGAKEVERPASSLTPGEQTRAYMAVFQANQVGVLILDEPTNHLDVEGVEQLELALSDYTGGLVVVSHDEAFCDAIHFTRVVDLQRNPH